MSGFAERWAKKHKEKLESQTSTKSGEGFAERWARNYESQRAVRDEFLGHLDTATINRARKLYEEDYAGKYDLLNKDDIEREQRGLMPASYVKKYKDTDIDEYLYNQMLPSSSDFTKYYNEAAELIKEEAKEAADAEADRLADYLSAHTIQDQATADKRAASRAAYSQRLMQAAQEMAAAEQKEKDRIAAMDERTLMRQLAEAKAVSEQLSRKPGGAGYTFLQKGVGESEDNKLQQEAFEMAAKRLERELTAKQASTAQNAPDYAAMAERGRIGNTRDSALHYAISDRDRDPAGPAGRVAAFGGGAVQESSTLDLFDTMTEDERDTYFAIMDKYGEDRAMAYFSSLREQLNQRRGMELAKEAEEGTLSALRKADLAFGSGVDQWASGTANLLFGAQATPASMYAAQKVRENISNPVGGVAFDVAQGVGNMLPSMGLSFLNPAAGAASLWVGAAGNAYKQALDDGYNEDDARLYGAVVGGMELALSKTLGGISAFGGKLTNNVVSRLVQNIPSSTLKGLATLAIRGGGEGLEEWIQSSTEPMLRNLFFGEENKFNPVSEEALYSALLGFLTAGLLESGGVAVETSTYSRQGKALADAKAVENLIDTASRMEEGSEARKIANSIRAGKTKQTNTNIGELFYAVQAEGGDVTSIYPKTEEQPEAAPEEAQAVTEAINAPVEYGKVGAEAYAELKKTAKDAAAFDADFRAAYQAGLRNESLNNASGAIPFETRKGAYLAGQADRNAANAPAQTSAAQTEAQAAPEPQTQGRVVATPQTATMNDTGAEVEISGISSVENGKIYYDTADGGTVSFDDISFLDPATEQLHAAAASYDTEGAKAFVQGYDGRASVEEYKRGFDLVHEAGRIGLSYEQATSGNERAKASLSPAAQRAAFAAGQTPVKGANARYSSAALRSAAANIVRASGQKATKANIRKAMRSIRTQFKLLDAIGKKYGVKIVVQDSIDAQDQSGNVKKSQFNGMYNPDTRTITIALDSTGEAHMYIGMHELVHYIKDMDGGQYSTLEKLAFEALEKNGQNVETLIQHQQNRGYSEQRAREEVVANTIPVILSDEVTIKRLVNENRTLARRIGDFLKDFVAEIQNALGRLSQSASFAQLDALKNDTESIQKMADAVFAALESVVDADASRGGSDVSFSPRLPRETISEEQIRNNRQAVAEMDPVATIMGDEYPKDGTPLSEKVKREYEKFGAVVENPEIGSVSLDKRGIKDDVSHGIGRLKSAAFAVLPDVVRSGKVVEAAYDWENKSYDAVVIAAPIAVGEEKYLMGVIVNKSEQVDRLHSHELVPMDKEKSASMLFKTGSPVSGTDSGNIKNASLPSLLYDIIDVKPSIVGSLKDLESMTPAQIAAISTKDANTTPKLKLKKPAEIDRGKAKESRLYQSSLESGIVEKGLSSLIKTWDDVKYYMPVSNVETLAEASLRLEEGEKETRRFERLQPQDADAVDVAEGIILLKQYQDKGDYEGALVVMEKLREIGTKAGQTVQAFSLLGRLTPEGMAVFAQKDLDKARTEMIKRYSEKWVEKHKDAFQLTPEEMEAIKELTIKASKLPEGRDKNIVLAQIASLIEAKLPTSALRMIKAYARNSMLLNPKTMLRNVIGNAIMSPMYIVQDFVSSGLDKAIAKKSGVRTVGLKASGGNIAAFKRGAFESYDDFRKHINTRQSSGDRFEIGMGDDFKRFTKEQIANASLAKRNAMRLSNALNKVDRLTGFLLDFGDRPFFEFHFTNSLNNQMRLNKAQEPTAEMIGIATDEALQRTWQDDNGYTKFVTNVRNAMNFGKDFGLGSLIVPFTKTPANITKALVEYSPIGLVKAIAADAKKYHNNTKNAAAQKAFVDSLSKGITGTLFMALAAAMANKGWITGGDDEKDKDLADFQKNIMGIAPYSVVVNGTSYTYDWAQPIGGLFAISADFVQSIQAGEEIDADTRFVGHLKTIGNTIINALSAGGNVVFEQSFLKGISNLFSDDGLVANLFNTSADFPSQFAPTLLSQIAQIIDPTARTSYVYRDIIATGKNKFLAKIPFARSELAPVVDTLGNEIVSFGGESRLAVGAQAFLSPANVYSSTATEVAFELRRVYDDTTDATIMPRKAPYYLEHKGTKYNFTPHERADYQKRTGQLNGTIIKEIMGKQSYMSLTSDEKAAVLNQITEYVSAVAKAEYLKTKGIEKELEGWITEAQEAKSVGLTVGEYIIAKNAAKGIESLKDKDGETITNSKGLQVMEAVYGVQGLKEKQREYLFEAFDVGKSVRHYNHAAVKEQLAKMRRQAK